jgi:hypothetical protein
MTGASLLAPQGGSPEPSHGRNLLAEVIIRDQVIRKGKAILAFSS